MKKLISVFKTIIGIGTTILYSMFLFLFSLAYAFVHDFKGGLLFFGDKCPKCGTRMIEYGFGGLGQRYECPNCGYTTDVMYYD